MSAEEALNILERLSKLSDDEFLNNDIYIFAAKGAFLTYIQAILDMANYIIAAKELGIPSSYGNILEILGDHGIIPNKWRKKLEKVIGIRDNILHSKEKISAKSILDLVREKTSFFKELLDLIRKELLSVI